MQDAHDDFRRRTLRFVLVVELDTCRNTPTVVGYGNRIICMNGNDNIVAVTRQRLINGVINNLEYHVVQTGSVRSITDIHPGPLTNCL